MKRGNRGFIAWLALVAGATALIGYLAWRHGHAVSDERDLGRLVYLVILLAMVSSSILLGRRLRLAQAAQHAVAWLLIAAVLAVGYSYRHDLAAVRDRVLGELVPHQGQAGGGEVRYRVGPDGHFRIEALIDGRPVRFLLDTGASDIVLSRDDAQRLGFDLARLNYSGLASTANGAVRTAPVRLGTLTVGPIRLTDIRASVNQGAMTTSLLGMRFLERLRGFEVRNGTLILRP